jgi:hypothetical protein
MSKVSVRTFNNRKYAEDSKNVYSSKRQAQQRAADIRRGGKWLARVVPISKNRKRYWKVYYAPKTP